MARVRLTPLGGVGRFGRNCLCVEVENGPAILVDCGVRFVSDESPGFDVGLPDLERISALGDRLLALVVTHGHEDHIGAIPYVIAERNVPIHATPFTAKLIARRFDRLGRSAPAVDVVDIATNAVREIGPFRVEWLAVSHSIPDASCVVIDVAGGRYVHSGDFRVDDDPVLGPKTDLEGLTRVGDGGVDVLLADSTGALIPGRNPGERSVAEALDEAVRTADERVFVALFASHVQRLALLAQSCRNHARRLCLLGTGLKETVRAARDLKLISVDDVLVSEADARNLDRNHIAYAVTGSQGESGSALDRLARGEHHEASIEAGDRVVISARVIPGNERKMLDVSEALAERGADVVDGSRAPHVSGHGYSGDLDLLLAATRPKAFVALHGNARHLLAHADLARTAGLARDRVVDLRDGSTLVVDVDAGIRDRSDMPAFEHLPGVRALEPLAVEGAVEMFASETVRSRKRMSSGGVLVVTPAHNGDARPRLIMRGIAPALPGDTLHAIEEDAKHALDVVGTAEEPAAIKAIARHFCRARRVAPEIVIVGSVHSPSVSTNE